MLNLGLSNGSQFLARKTTRTIQVRNSAGTRSRSHPHSFSRNGFYPSGYESNWSAASDHNS